MSAQKKHNWPSREEFLQYKADNYSAPEVAEMIRIPVNQVRRRLADMKISLRNDKYPRFMPEPEDYSHVKPAESLDINSPAETIDEFIARGGQITYLPAETVPYTGRGPAHHFGREIDV
jgi:xanthine dehydrogenase iron-sulfur cluster and FAD-binding subunit A